MKGNSLQLHRIKFSDFFIHLDLVYTSERNEILTENMWTLFHCRYFKKYKKFILPEIYAKFSRD